MAQKKLITDLINEWKPRQLLSDEVGANLDTVHKWAAANRIPTEWQAAVSKAAQNRGLKHINGDWMMKVHQRHLKVTSGDAV